MHRPVGACPPQHRLERSCPFAGIRGCPLRASILPTRPPFMVASSTRCKPKAVHCLHQHFLLRVCGPSSAWRRGSQAQEERGLEDVRQTGSAKRKAAIKRAREEGERRCLEELKALAEGARYRPVCGEHEWEGRGATPNNAAGVGCHKINLVLVEGRMAYTKRRLRQFPPMGAPDHLDHLLISTLRCMPYTLAARRTMPGCEWSCET